MSQITDLSPYCRYFRRSLKKFISKQVNNMFYKYQSGFKSNHSTDQFLSFLNDKILKDFDNGLYTGMILIELQKAFDTINHKILLDKLLPIDCTKNTIIWYEPYLAKRRFAVEVKKLGFKIRKCFIWCSTSLNFRPFTVFNLLFLSCRI